VPAPINQKAVEALVSLCGSVAKRSPVDTSDSWVHGAGRDQVEATLTTLKADPAIAQHLEHGNSLYLAGSGFGFGMTPANHWLGGFVRYALARPASEWEHIAERFRSFLAMERGTAPFMVNTTLIGVLLVNTEEIELSDGVLRTAQFDRNAHRSLRGGPLPAVVFQYEAELPAAIASAPVLFLDVVAEEATRAHEEAISRLLLALAFSSGGAAQIDASMYEPLFSGSSAGGPSEDAGPIAAGRLTMLNPTAAKKLRQEYAALAGVPVKHVGIAVRRFLIARSERVRPADQVIDYAIALESMTRHRGGPEQGKELGNIVARDDAERQVVESKHALFRNVRNSIVHDGNIPANVKEAASIGEDLVLRALRARVCPQ
jgi:hypothetical protein